MEGIIEDYISSRWFDNTCKSKTGIVILNLKELGDKYPKEKFTKELFDEFSEHLSFFLVALVKLKNPDCIIIGGNIGKP